MTGERDGIRELIEETATKLGHSAVKLYPPGPAREAYLRATIFSLKEIGERLFRDPPDVAGKAMAGHDAAAEQFLQHVFHQPAYQRTDGPGYTNEQGVFVPDNTRQRRPRATVWPF